MADEQRIRLMIDLARYENGTGKEELRLRRYYRSDYIALEIIKALLFASFSYILVIGLIMLGNLDYLLDNMTNMDIRTIGSYFLIGYLIFIGIYIAIAYIRAVIQYKKARKGVRDYLDRLRLLDRLS